MDMALARRSGQQLQNSYVITNSTEHAPLRRFFKAAVDALQLVFDRSLVTSVQPKSLLVQMREAVANCDDVSSDGSLMLLSPPHDIPEATLPAESSMDQETWDEFSPVVIPRRVTPANRPLQYLEAGRLGASTPQHVRSRPAVPDLCIASSSLLSVLDPLPMDRLSRQSPRFVRGRRQIVTTYLPSQTETCGSRDKTSQKCSSTWTTMRHTWQTVPLQTTIVSR